MSITNDEKIAIMNRTVDWLEANPDNAIRGAMAKDKHGNHCSPFDPRATCFCFVGRLALNADVRGQDTGDFKIDIEHWLSSLRASRGDLQSRNDGNPNHGRRFHSLRSYIEQLG